MFPLAAQIKRDPPFPSPGKRSGQPDWRPLPTPHSSCRPFGRALRDGFSPQPGGRPSRELVLLWGRQVVLPWRAGSSGTLLSWPTTSTHPGLPECLERARGGAPVAQAWPCALLPVQTLGGGALPISKQSAEVGGKEGLPLSAVPGSSHASRHWSSFLCSLLR